jgi:hypothetical protein
VHAAETLVETTGMEQNELLIRHEWLMWAISEGVSKYWSHVTEGHRRDHSGSVEDYLHSLVQRGQRADEIAPTSSAD